MRRRTKTLSVVLTLVCVMFFGIQIDGRSQETSGGPEGPVVQQPPTTQQPYTNPRMKRRGLIVIADLNITPLTYTGSCPAVFTLKGQIYANRAMTVLYKIVRSDNVPMEPIALTFEQEGRKEITHTWQIGDPTKSTRFNEWALIEAVYPLNTKIRSNVAFLKGSCGDKSDFKQIDEPGQQEGQKRMPAGPTGFPGPQPQGKGPVPIGPPVVQQGRQREPVADLPMIPPGQGTQAPGVLPMPQSGQKGSIPMDPVMPQASPGRPPGVVSE